MQFLKKGNLFSAMYVIIMAFSVVWIDFLKENFNQFLMLALVSFSAIVFYNAIAIRSLKKAYSSILRHPSHWFFMSFFFAMTWWLIYFTTIHTSPRAVMVSFYLVVAICGCFFDKKYLYAIFCIIAFIIGFLILPELTIKTIFPSVMCGLCGYVYMKLSGTYAKKNSLSATQLLATRFYILFFISVIYIFFFKRTGFHVSLDSNLFLTTGSLILLIIFNLAPNYCAQRGVVLIGVDKFSQAITATPVLTFILQGFYENKWNIGALILCAMVSLLLNLIAHQR